MNSITMYADSAVKAESSEVKLQTSDNFRLLVHISLLHVLPTGCQVLVW